MGTISGGGEGFSLLQDVYNKLLSEESFNVYYINSVCKFIGSTTFLVTDEIHFKPMTSYFGLSLQYVYKYACNPSTSSSGSKTFRQLMIHNASGLVAECSMIDSIVQDSENFLRADIPCDSALLVLEAVTR